MTTTADDLKPSGAARTNIRAALQSAPVALALAALFWSGNFVVGRALRDSVDPIALNFLRWAIAFVVIAPFVWKSTLDALLVLRREWQLILALGATGIATSRPGSA